jgi:hypothetical protein
MLKFLHILKEQAQKKLNICCQKTKLKMAAKTTFFILQRLSFALVLLPIQLCVFKNFEPKKNEKIFRSSKIKYGRSIQDDRQKLIYSQNLKTIFFIKSFFCLIVCLRT